MSIESPSLGQYLMPKGLCLALMGCIGVNQDGWLLEYPWPLEKNKNWSDGVLEWWKRTRTGVLAYGSERVMEYWSVGLKSGNGSDFLLFYPW